jgi:hypothetical protein
MFHHQSYLNRLLIHLHVLIGLIGALLVAAPRKAFTQPFVGDYLGSQNEQDSTNGPRTADLVGDSHAAKILKPPSLLTCYSGKWHSAERHSSLVYPL